MAGNIQVDIAQDAMPVVLFAYPCKTDDRPFGSHATHGNRPLL